MTIKLSNTVMPALLVVPPKGGVEVASFKGANGDVIVCNANIEPYSPIDGEPMQVLSSERTIVPRKTLLSNTAFVQIGTCQSCGANLRATASFADAIEVSGEHVYCPHCASAVKPDISITALTAALAAEFSPDDEDEADSDDAGSDDVTDSTDDDYDTDSDDDYDTDSDDDYDTDSDDDYDTDSDDEFEGSDSDDDGTDSDDDGTDEDDAEIARLATRIRKIRARKAARASEDDADKDSADAEDEQEEVSTIRGLVRRGKARRARASEDDADVNGDRTDADNDGVDDDEEMTTAVAMLRKEMARLGIASEDDTELNGLDRDGIVDDPDEDIKRSEATLASDDDSDTESDDDSDECASEERVPAGRARPRAGVERANDAARARLRDRNAGRVNGNRLITSMRAAIAEVESEDAVSEQPGTPGTSDTPSDAVSDRTDDVTPGTVTSVKEDGVRDEPTPGTSVTADKDHEDVDAAKEGADEMIDGLASVDWRVAKIDILNVASDDSVKLVLANGNPVARLHREKASAGVVGQWDTPLLASAFAEAAKRGLVPAEAAEFGLVPFRFRLEGSAVIRGAIRRSADLATQNAQREIARGVERYRQALKTATIAALKGTFPDLPNPIRDRLAADLAKMSVVEPRSVVDRAVAASVTPFLDAVFRKADEIAAKPDAARNELANIVAMASYQSRAGVGQEFAERLQEKSVAVSTVGLPTPVPAAGTAGVSDTSVRVRAALRSIK
jgi:hypothetical protein